VSKRGEIAKASVVLLEFGLSVKKSWQKQISLAMQSYFCYHCYSVHLTASQAYERESLCLYAKLTWNWDTLAVCRFEFLSYFSWIRYN